MFHRIYFASVALTIQQFYSFLLYMIVPWRYYKIQFLGAVFIGGWRLSEGGAYQRKYGI